MWLPPGHSGEESEEDHVVTGSAPLSHTLYIQMQCYDAMTLQHWLVSAIVSSHQWHIPIFWLIVCLLTQSSTHTATVTDSRIKGCYS